MSEVEMVFIDDAANADWPKEEKRIAPERASRVARAIVRGGGKLRDLFVRATPRPKGGWKWGAAYSYGVYHPARKRALAVADAKIQARKEGDRYVTGSPARGWEDADRDVQREAELLMDRIRLAASLEIARAQRLER